MAPPQDSAFQTSTSLPTSSCLRSPSAFAASEERRGHRPTAARAGGLDVAGSADRTGTTAVRAQRGNDYAHRPAYEKVGGQSDYQIAAERGDREWRRELLAEPTAVRSAGETGHRTSIAASAEKRRARVAKSPFKAPPNRERGGMLTSFMSPIRSRCEDVAEQ